MKRIKMLAGVLAIIFAMSAAYLYSALPGLMATAKEEILKATTNTLNGALSLDQVRLSGFMEISADNVLLKDHKGRTVFTSSYVAVRINPFTWLYRFKDGPVAAISSVKLAKDSQVFLSLNKKGQWNIENIIKPSDKEETPFYGAVRLDETNVNIDTPQGKWLLVATGNIDASANPDFSFNIGVQQDKNQLALSGSINSKGQGNVRLASDRIDVAPFANVIGSYTNIHEAAGILQSVRLVWENKGGGNSFSGEAKLLDVAGEYKYDGDKVRLLLNGGIKAKNNVMDFADLAVSLNEQKTVVSGGLDINKDIPVARELVLATDAFNPGLVFKDSPWQGSLAVKLTLDGQLEKQLAGLNASGQVGFEEGKLLSIPFADGKVSFNLQEGNFVLSESVAVAMGGKLFLSGKYEYNKDLLSASANLDGADLATAFKDQGLSGDLSGRIVLEGRPSWSSISAVGDIKSQHMNWRGLNINSLDSRIVRTGGKTVLEQLSAKCGGGNIIASGLLEGAPLSVEAAGDNLPLSELLPLAGFDGYGLLTARAHIRGSLAYPEGDIAFYAKDGVVTQQPFKFIEGRAKLYDQLLTIDKFIAEMNYGLHAANGRVNFAQPGIGLDVEVISKSVRIEPLAALLAPGEKITGNADNRLLIGGTVASPVYNGHIAMQEGSFRDQYVEQVSGKYVYSDNGLTLNNFNITIMQMHIDLNGHMTPAGKLAFDFKGNNMRLDNLPMPTEVKVDGGVNMQGHLSGNIDKPVFNGSINGSQVNINGQTITDISGEAWSEGFTNNYFRINFRHGKGEYKLDAGIDYNARFAQGLLEIKNGDLKSLLAVAGQHFDVGGTLDGTVELNQRGRSGMRLVAQVTKANIRDIPVQIMDVDLHLQRGKLTINKLEATQNLGRIAGRGTVDFRGAIDVELGGNNLNAALLTAFMDNPIDFGGNMSFLMQLSGSTQHPALSASVQISPGRMSNVVFDNLYGLFSVKDDIFHIDQLFIEKDANRLSAYGVVPVDLIRQKENRKRSDSQMDVTVKLDNADLAIVPSLFGSRVEWGLGRTEGTVNAKGTLEKPLFYGDVVINDGTLKFKDLRNPLEHIILDVNFSGDKVLLNKCSASMGTGTVTAQGSLGLSSLSDMDYRLAVKTDKLAIASEMLTGPLTCNFEVSPQTFRGGKRPLIKGDMSLDNMLINLPVVPDFGEGTTNLGLDVTVKAGNNTRLYNKYLYDMLLEGNLHITGSTNYTNVGGNVNVIRGNIKYLGTTFKIEDATAGFPTPGSPLPHINLFARTRVSNTDVFARINGPVTEMDVKLASNPPLSQQEIFRLITLKTRTSSDGASSLSDDDMKTLLAAGLQMTIFGDVENFLRNAWGLDEFRLYQGQINSGMGTTIDSARASAASKEEREQYNIYVSKYISDRVLIGYTSNLDNSERRYNARYDFSRRMSFSAAMDQDNNFYYGLEYRISF